MKKKHSSVEGFTVKTLQISGFYAAFQALRLPFGKEMRSKGEYSFIMWNDHSFTNNVTFDADEQDIRLLSSLVHRGDEHAKVLRGVMVWCEINAPIYFWKQMDTYRIGAERLSSESSMHIQGKGLNEEELIDLQEKMPGKTMQKRVWMFSYQTLRRIYFQRKDHRLPQWRTLCEWIEKLPFAEELLIG